MKSLEMLEDLRFKGKGLPMQESYYEECYNIIKKDLEILEIMKRNITSCSLEQSIKFYTNAKENYNIEFKGKIEDYTKIKKWLEE